MDFHSLLLFLLLKKILSENLLPLLILLKRDAQLLYVNLSLERLGFIIPLPNFYTVVGKPTNTSHRNLIEIDKSVYCPTVTFQ